MPATWPPKVPKGFPLTIVARGYMARIGGRPRWICGKRSPDEALAIYHRKAVALTAGTAPMTLTRKPGAAPTLHAMLNRWLDQKLADADAGELTHRSYMQYRLSAKRINAVAIGQLVGDINPEWTQELYNRLRTAHGIDGAKRAIAHLRTAALFAEDMKWVDRVSLGNQLIRKLTSRPKAEMKWKLYGAADVRNILAASLRGIRRADGRSLPSKVQLHAMILLALNGGLGAKELSDLQRAAIDLANARIDFSRIKTGANHIVPLWSRTIAALKMVLEQRPGDGLLFRTREGNPWCRPSITRAGKRIKIASWIDNVNERFVELIRPLGLKIRGQGFYKLKHLHCSIADRAGDPHATFALAGHKLPGEKSSYVKIDEGRLRVVVDFVHRELLSRPNGRKLPPSPSVASQPPSDARGTRSHRSA